MFTVLSFLVFEITDDLNLFYAFSKFYSILYKNIECLNKKESESEVAQSCPTLCDPTDSRLPQASPSMGFSKQEYWSGLPFPSPGNLPNPGIEPRSVTL